MKGILALLLAILCSAAFAETVTVKYHGPVPLDAFSCAEVSENSDVTRICYDAAERYMIVRLKATYYHYCSIDGGTVQALRAAPFKRQYFDTKIRGSGSDGPFDCRTHPIPKKYRL